MPGEYNFYNIMVAICIGKHFNVPTDAIRRSLEDYEPNINRSQIVEYKGARVLLDAYNANPSSMKVSIESFYVQSQKGSRVLILGDMFELGKDSNLEHKKVLSLLKEKNIENVALIGKEFKKASKEFAQFKYFVDFKMLKKWFLSNEWKGFDVFIKGSRAMSLEKLLT
jgi:UDP-N-acetylmuramoyl-tripeptide--D-alanyl-D-alanine ligase